FTFFSHWAVHGILRFSHHLKNRVRNMFRRYFELPAYVIFAMLQHKGIILICHDIIKPDTGTDKDLLDLRYFPEASQELQVVFMIHIQIFAWFREQALSVLTCSVSQLLVTGRM